MTTMREEYELNAPACPDLHERIAELEREVARLTAHLTQPAQAVDVGFDGALNDAGWAFIEAMPVPLPGPVFNNVKTALKAAIEKWLATRDLAGEQAGWRVPDELPEDDPVDADRRGEVLSDYQWGYNQGWNDCRYETLNPRPTSPTPDKETQR